MIELSQMFLNSAKKTIVIAGAGFGGLRTAINLNKAFKKNPALAREYNLYLVDQNDHHLFTPAVYEITSTAFDDAKAQKLKQIITLPLEKIFKTGPLRFLQARISKIDARKGVLFLNDKTSLGFDFLVAALGAETNFYGIPGLKENTLTLGGLSSAVIIRNRIEKKFCEALREKKVFSVVFGGGGVTGVELAGEILGYLKKLNRKYDSKIKSNITVIESQTRILPGFSETIIGWAETRLKKLGVKIETGEFISEANESKVLTKSGRSFDFDILIWSGGIKPNHLVESLPFKKDSKGRVQVNRNFCPVFEAATPETAGECSNILVIGDSCSLIMKGQPMPQTAQMAIDEGAHAARVILAKIQKKKTPLYHPMPNRYILPLGGKFALADLGFIKAKGFLVWILKEFVFLDYLFSVLSPFETVSHWLQAVSLFTKND